jgi:hypothetical protein
MRLKMGTCKEHRHGLRFWLRKLQEVTALCNLEKQASWEVQRQVTLSTLSFHIYPPQVRMHTHTRGRGGHME